MDAAVSYRNISRLEHGDIVKAFADGNDFIGRFLKLTNHRALIDNFFQDGAIFIVNLTSRGKTFATELRDNRLNPTVQITCDDRAGVFVFTNECGNFFVKLHAIHNLLNPF